jgi:hypothetical protein
VVGRSDSAAAFWTPVAVLYAGSLLVAIAHLPDLAGIGILAVLALAVGAAIVLRTNLWNVWVLFTVGFVQPIVLGIPAAIHNFETYLGAFSLTPSLIGGAICSLGGIGAALAQRRLTRESFSVKTWASWISVAGKPISKAEVVVKAINTLIAVWGLVQLILRFL